MSESLAQQGIAGRINLRQMQDAAAYALATFDLSCQ